MGLCESEIKNKEEIDNPLLYNKNIIPVLKSLCQIKTKNKEEFIIRNGFFMNISTKKYLITNYHIISQDKINNDIDIELHNKKIIKLDLNNRDIKYYPDPIDITLIEIYSSDIIYKDIEFLDYDANFIKNGYEVYKNIDIFLIQENATCSYGKIIKIINKYEFEYNISNITNENCLSGCPILSFDNNSIKVIGIKKGIKGIAQNKTNKTNNYGIFIGEIITAQINNINNNLNSNNYIIAEISISKNEINDDIRIINSYEEYERCLGLDNKEYEIEKEKMNEELIKNIQIEINNELIPFSYLYKFPKEGIYTIKYSFNNKRFNNINININHIFSECVNIISIDFSNFNSDKITNMCYAFYKCKNLSKINLANLNTQNVNDMSYIFCRCKNLINLNLSNFNTSNVTNMKDMFSWCESLLELNLSNFTTNHVTDMYGMFCGCKSLKQLDLSNFNTNNVKDMNLMFCGCKELEKINLENFRTDNVVDIIDMFSGCQKLKKENIVTKDNRIKEVKIIKTLNKM